MAKDKPTIHKFLTYYSYQYPTLMLTFFVGTLFFEYLEEERWWALALGIAGIIGGAESLRFGIMRHLPNISGEPEMAKDKPTIHKFLTYYSYQYPTLILTFGMGTLFFEYLEEERWWALALGFAGIIGGAEALRFGIMRHFRTDE